ncbi:MAG: hypothetical protein J3R72DRAFT_492025 [Linnemannia gamsii]|nr:MAG: hypothetical protein J3R72DRAFT_492025 [Linnemannia gamsii]
MGKAWVTVKPLSTLRAQRLDEFFTQAQTLCLISMPYFYALSLRLISVPRHYASSLYLITTLHLYASSLRLVSIPRHYASSLYLVTTPRLYTWSLRLVSNLKSNSIGDNGVQALSEALKTNSTLTTMGLDGNSIGSDEAKALTL